jgi:curli biogenesis system outer membrane secretion channel CsgG
MRKVVGLALLSLILSAPPVFASARPSSALPPPSDQRSQAPYAGPRVRISVTEIRDKTAGGGVSTQMLQKYNIPWKAIGEGMREMLVTALFKTKRFAVLERDLLEEILKEQDLAASGRVQGGTGAATGGIVGADLIITGAVTEFVTDALTVKGGAEVAGTQIDGTMNKGYVGLDIRIIDAKTSEVVVATYVMGRANSYGLEADPGEEAKLPISLSIFAHTPAERAIRNAIQKAVADIVQMTPAEYYRH